jgi:hypothetical protein
MVVHSCNPNFQEDETGGGQLGLNKETLSYKKLKNQIEVKTFCIQIPKETLYHSQKITKN